MTQNIFSVWYLDAIIIDMFSHVCVCVLCAIVYSMKLLNWTNFCVWLLCFQIFIRVSDLFLYLGYQLITVHYFGSVLPLILVCA